MAGDKTIKSMTISLKVEGEEDMDLSLTFKDTTLATVITYEQKLIAAIGEILASQQSQID